MVDHRGFPYASFPSGWYQVAWSDELASGRPLPLRYFDTDLVLYRGASGRPHLMTAICPHMGAHIGYGGSVVGDAIECPYHGWQFNADGENQVIPYAGRPNRTRLQRWEVVEVGPLVLTWYDEGGEKPWFEPFAVPEFDDLEQHAAPEQTRRIWQGARMKPQFLTENLVDAAHQKFVHRAAEIPDIESYAADGGFFRVHSTIVFGQGKGKTWLTPDGKPTAAALRTEACGIGLTCARFDIDGTVHIAATTPVDHEYVDSRTTVIVPSADIGSDGRPSDNARRRFEHECKQFERDLLIWEHQRYVHPVPFPQLERDRFRTFRNWTAQFYPEAERGRFGRMRDVPADVVVQP